MTDLKELQDSCAHEETQVEDMYSALGAEETVAAHDVCIKCGKDLGEHEPWTPDTLEEAHE